MYLSIHAWITNWFFLQKKYTPLTFTQEENWLLWTSSSRHISYVAFEMKWTHQSSHTCVWSPVMLTCVTSLLFKCVHLEFCAFLRNAECMCNSNIWTFCPSLLFILHMLYCSYDSHVTFHGYVCSQLVTCISRSYMHFLAYVCNIYSMCVSAFNLS